MKSSPGSTKLNPEVEIRANESIRILENNPSYDNDYINKHNHTRHNPATIPKKAFNNIYIMLYNP